MNVFEFQRLVRASELPTGPRLTLFTLTTYASGSDDFFVFPSVEELAKGLPFAKRAVKRHLAALKKAGWITPQRRQVGQRRKANGYHLHVPTEEGGQKVSEKAPSQGVRNDTMPGLTPSEAQSDTPPVATGPEKVSLATPCEGVRNDTRKVSGMTSSPHTPLKEEETREETRASQPAARTHESTEPSAPAAPPSKPARPLPSVDFPDKPGPPVADYDADLVAEARREWNEAHKAANITRVFAMGSSWIQTHFGPLSAQQRGEVWMAFRRKLLDGTLRSPEGYIRATCQGIATDNKVVPMRRPQKHRPEQPSWVGDYSKWGEEDLAILRGEA